MICFFLWSLFAKTFAKYFRSETWDHLQWATSLMPCFRPSTICTLPHTWHGLPSCRLSKQVRNIISHHSMHQRSCCIRLNELTIFFHAFWVLLQRIGPIMEDRTSIKMGRITLMLLVRTVYVWTGFTLVLLWRSVGSTTIVTQFSCSYRRTVRYRHLYS